MTGKSADRSGIGGGRYSRKIVVARRANCRGDFAVGEQGDYEVLPDYLRAGITVHFVRSFREVFDIVFEDSSERRQLH